MKILSGTTAEHVRRTELFVKFVQGGHQSWRYTWDQNLSTGNKGDKYIYIQYQCFSFKGKRCCGSFSCPSKKILLFMSSIKDNEFGWR